MTDPKLSVRPEYVVEQLAQALANAAQHRDAEVRARAAEKVRKWCQVFDGMIRGSLIVGSRTPVEAIPAWATLEVAHGGFATGNLLAGGTLQAHETELLGRLDASGLAPGRTALNLYYLTDAGREELTAALRSGRYSINVPEEGALLTVAWLMANGATDEAGELLDAIAPFFDRLRFYPVRNTRPLVAGTTVRLQPIGKTAEGLRAAKQQRRVPVMNEALTVWAPLYDRAVALFLETVEGPLPALRTNGGGELVRRPDGPAAVEGGWPCRRYPDGWTRRAKTLLEDYDRERAVHPLSKKPERKKENFALLRAYLRQAVDDPSTLTGREVGMIRKVLASFVTRRGVPGSERLANLRANQMEVGSRATHRELRSIVLSRLSALSSQDGIQSIDLVGAPVTEEESDRHHVRVGEPMPDSILRKLERSLEAPVEELVALGVISSGEVLGLVLPQVTAQIRAAGITDPDLRRLYAAVYAAFRRRRSLLLLNLEHQVKLEELPWIAAMNAFRARDASAAEEAARGSLRQLSLLALTSFPQTILPNKLLQELRALATSSNLELFLVDELAADIFMGAFSEKFLRAAQAAGRLLKGTLYERYYGISFDEVLQIDDVENPKYGAPSSPAFAHLCSRLAGAASSAEWSVAKNGTIIEQEQILTTHNLATLVAGGLETRIRGELLGLTRRCFVWLCRQLQQKRTTWKSRLKAVKNAAYAWRQMLFFLSVEGSSVEEFVRWAEEHFETQAVPFRGRFGPAIRGLSFVARGGRFDDAGRAPDGARRFLGWTTERHWAFGPDENKSI